MHQKLWASIKKDQTFTHLSSRESALGTGKQALFCHQQLVRLVYVLNDIMGMDEIQAGDHRESVVKHGGDYGAVEREEAIDGAVERVANHGTVECTRQREKFVNGKEGDDLD